MENVHTDVRVKRVKYHLFLKIEGFERFFVLIIFFIARITYAKSAFTVTSPVE